MSDYVFLAAPLQALRICAALYIPDETAKTGYVQVYDTFDAARASAISTIASKGLSAAHMRGEDKAEYVVMKLCKSKLGAAMRDNKLCGGVPKTAVHGRLLPII